MKGVKAVMESKDKARAPNGIQRKTGYDETPLMRGEVQIGKLNSKKHLTLLKMECILRGMSEVEAASLKFRKAVDYIRQNEREKRPDESEDNIKFFEPKHDSEEWQS